MLHNIADNFSKHNIRFSAMQEAAGFSLSQHGVKIKCRDLKVHCERYDHNLNSNYQLCRETAVLIFMAVLSVYFTLVA